MTTYKSGYVAFFGPPNAGKSTLLNRILGSKLAIISAKPQTTRHRIAGVHTDETMQAVLVDTPGIHEAWTELNKSMVGRTLAVLEEADVALWVVDMTLLGKAVEDNAPILDAAYEHMAQVLEQADIPIIVVANKIDVVPRPLLLPVIEALSNRLTLKSIVPISALNGDGVDDLLAEIRDSLPAGPQLYPEDEWAQVTERFLVAEVIREKIFHLTEREIPYSTAVEIRSFDESDRDTEDIVRIHADIIVERPTQKGIMIGKGGEMAKRIGTLARKELQELLGCRVRLDLFVRVEKNWTRTKRGLRRVGFDE